MSWDRKRRGSGKGYYYRSVRLNGRPTKQYLGVGPGAEKVARQVEERKTARREVREEEARLAAIDLIHDELSGWLRLLVRAHLVIGGMYEHHGGWRRRRGRTAQAA